ncbi:putative membrane protein [Synechococcus sp. A15-24]|nr:putative membrane protein [Synechococcus sp. A15-24]
MVTIDMGPSAGPLPANVGFVGVISGIVWHGFLGSHYPLA